MAPLLLTMETTLCGAGHVFKAGNWSECGMRSLECWSRYDKVAATGLACIDVVVNDPVSVTVK